MCYHDDPETRMTKLPEKSQKPKYPQPQKTKQ
jgi:hypothetical protein